MSKLIFLHGFMGHPSDWDEIRVAFPEYESDAVDMKPAFDWTAGIRQLADCIPDQSILVGYSMGARLALGVAIEAPRKCAGMVFISGNPGLETDEARQQRWRADQNIAKRLQFEPLVSFLKDWYSADVFFGTPEAIRRIEMERKLARAPDAWPAILHTNSVSRQPNYWNRLNELSMPVLVVAGEADEKYRMIAVRFGGRCSEQDVSIKLVNECGHAVHREQPAVLTELIRDFVESMQKE